MATGGQGAAITGAQVGYKRHAFIGSCKHHIWKAIRASSAAPYYLDDFSDGVHRWQDGAIVANNPTIFAIREAQLLWPDAKIDCLVSVGCGSVPLKIGAWRDRIVIFTGIYGPVRALTKAFLDSGAKAVICPSSEPEETPITSFHGAGEFSTFENEKFEIGEEEADDDDSEPPSPASDWEDSEPEKNGEQSLRFLDDDEK